MISANIAAIPPPIRVRLSSANMSARVRAVRAIHYRNLLGPARPATAITVEALRMNRLELMNLRQALLAVGVHPPSR